MTVSEIEPYQAHAPAQQGDPGLTAEDIARRLAEIHAVQDDDEVAHGKTDDLHRDVLAAIAAGAPDARLLAAAALRTETLGFARWCA